MSNRELAEWLLNNKESLLCMIGGYIDNYIQNYQDKDNLFKETKYIKDLNEYVALELKECTSILMEDTLNWEELNLLFDDDKVKEVVRKEFARQYLYN